MDCLNIGKDVIVIYFRAEQKGYLSGFKSGRESLILFRIF